MTGNAEKRNGMAKKLCDVLKIGEYYSIKDLALLIGNDPRGMQGGVIPKDDAQLLLVTLLDPKYPDEVLNDTLHWYGQENLKHAERHIIDGTRDALQHRNNPLFLLHFIVSRGVSVCQQQTVCLHRFSALCCRLFCWLQQHH